MSLHNNKQSNYNIKMITYLTLLLGLHLNLFYLRFQIAIKVCEVIGNKANDVVDNQSGKGYI